MQYRCLTLAAELKKGNIQEASCPIQAVATTFDEVADKLVGVSDWALKLRIAKESEERK